MPASDDVYGSCVDAAAVITAHGVGVSDGTDLSSRDVDYYLRNKWKLSIDSKTVSSSPIIFKYRITSDIPQYNSPKLFAPTMIPGFFHSTQAIRDTKS